MEKRTVSVLAFTGLLLFPFIIGVVEAVGYTDVTVTEAKDMIDSNPFLVILDVRTQSEFASGHIRNAKLIPLTELEERLDELNQTDEILVYCLSGGRSRTASQLLVDNGFLYVYNMLGGITAWIGEGYPVYVRYTSIQEAINNATEGDTIFVSSGTYYENVVVNKSLSLVGENAETTIVDGNGIGSVVYVSANNTVVKGFTIQNGFRGVWFNHSNGNAFSQSNILSCDIRGVDLSGSNNNTIMNITVSAIDWIGISIESSSDNVVAGNTVTNTTYGIRFIGSSHANTIEGNSLTSNVEGIHLNSNYNNVVNNDLSNNSIAIDIWSWYNNITGNLMHNMIRIEDSNYNRIYHNNLYNVVISWHGLIHHDNIWDDGYPPGGNYWNGYTDVDEYCGPDQDIPRSDGIWDHPFVINVNNTDHYPLKTPHSSGSLSVSISTDTSTYHAGDTMHVGLHVENPDSVKYVCFAFWATLPDNSIYLSGHDHSVILPIGLEHTSFPFASFTLPALPPGIYTWHAAFLERATHTTLVEDTAEWEFA